MNTEKLNFTVPSKARMFSFLLMAVGLVSIVVMFLTDHVDGDPEYHQTRAWSNVFAGSFFFAAAAAAAAAAALDCSFLSCFFFLSLSFGLLSPIADSFSAIVTPAASCQPASNNCNTSNGAGSLLYDRRNEFPSTSLFGNLSSGELAKTQDRLQFTFALKSYMGAITTTTHSLNSIPQELL